MSIQAEITRLEGAKAGLKEYLESVGITVTDDILIDGMVDLLASIEQPEYYPVNSIYISYSNTSPAELFGGTWQRIESRFLWGCPSTSEIGLTAGEMTHTLTASEMPSHNHLIYDNSAAGRTGAHVWPTTWKTNADAGSMKGSSIGWAGGGGAHNNMPPYVSVAIWRRTA